MRIEVNSLRVRLNRAVTAQAEASLPIAGALTTISTTLHVKTIVADNLMLVIHNAATIGYSHVDYGVGMVLAIIHVAVK